MEETKLAVCFICCVLVGTSLSAAIPSSRNNGQLQGLEHRIEELKEELELLKEESFQHRSRRTVNGILNENRKLANFISVSYAACMLSRYS